MDGNTLLECLYQANYDSTIAFSQSFPAGEMIERGYDALEGTV